jgi:thioesterase domain-containing protein
MPENYLDYYRASPFKKALIRKYYALKTYLKSKLAFRSKLTPEEAAAAEKAAAEAKAAAIEAADKEERNQYPDALPEDLEARRIEVRENYRRIFDKMTHFKQIVKTPILVLKVKEKLENQIPPDDPRWNPRVVKKMSFGVVEICYTSGNHFNMFYHPYVEELAGILLEKLASMENGDGMKNV